MKKIILGGIVLILGFFGYSFAGNCDFDGYSIDNTTILNYNIAHTNGYPHRDSLTPTIGTGVYTNYLGWLPVQFRTSILKYGYVLDYVDGGHKVAKLVACDSNDNYYDFGYFPGNNNGYFYFDLIDPDVTHIDYEIWKFGETFGQVPDGYGPSTNANIINSFYLYVTAGGYVHLFGLGGGYSVDSNYSISPSVITWSDTSEILGFAFDEFYQNGDVGKYNENNLNMFEIKENATIFNDDFGVAKIVLTGNLAVPGQSFSFVLSGWKLQYRSDSGLYSIYNSTYNKRLLVSDLYKKLNTFINDKNELILTVSIAEGQGLGAYCAGDSTTCLYFEKYYNLDNALYTASSLYTGEFYTSTFDKITNLVSQNDISLYNLKFENEFTIYSSEYSGTTYLDDTLIYMGSTWNHNIIYAEFGFNGEDYADLMYDNNWNFYLKSSEWIYNIENLYKKLGIESFVDIYGRKNIKYTVKLFKNEYDPYYIYEHSRSFPISDLTSCQQVANNTLLWTGTVVVSGLNYMDYSIRYLNPNQKDEHGYYSNYKVNFQFITGGQVNYIMTTDQYSSIVCQDGTGMYITHSEYLSGVYLSDVLTDVKYYKGSCLESFHFDILKQGEFMSGYSRSNLYWGWGGTTGDCYIDVDGNGKDTIGNSLYSGNDAKIVADGSINFFACPEKYNQYKGSFEINIKNIFGGRFSFVLPDYDLLGPVGCMRGAVIYGQKSSLINQQLGEVISSYVPKQIWVLPISQNFINSGIDIINLLLFIPGLIILGFSLFPSFVFGSNSENSGSVPHSSAGNKIRNRIKNRNRSTQKIVYK